MKDLEQELLKLLVVPIEFGMIKTEGGIISLVVQDDPDNVVRHKYARQLAKSVRNLAAEHCEILRSFISADTRPHQVDMAWDILEYLKGCGPDEVLQQPWIDIQYVFIKVGQGVYQVNILTLLALIAICAVDPRVGVKLGRRRGQDYRMAQVVSGESDRVWQSLLSQPFAADPEKIRQAFDPRRKD